MADQVGAELAYGVQVESRDEDTLQQALEELRESARIPDVRYLRSGRYDRELFLVIKVFEAEAGNPRAITIGSLVHAYYSDWDDQLETACKALDIQSRRGPSWLLIPYIS